VQLLLALVLSATLTAGAQVAGQASKPNRDSGTFTMSVSSNLVIEAVNVKDKQGNAIAGLTANDFTVTENGVKQVVKICEYQELPIAPNPVPVKPMNREDITVFNRLAVSQIASEKRGDGRYHNKRLIAMYFDLMAMTSSGDKLRAIKAAEKFIRAQMTSADMVALMRYGGSSMDVLQDFTGDHNKLLSILETLIVGENQQNADTTDDAATADTGEAFGQDNSEFNLFNTDRQLSALQTAAQELGRLSEKKVLMYFASGLPLHGVDNQAQLHATIDDAIRSGVSFWPIDSRGLVAQTPLGDATQASPGNVGMYSGAAAMAVTTRMQQSQDTLYALAADTGGKALLDSNDLTRGIVQAQQSISSYYILGYYTDGTMDGKFRRVKVSVNPELDAKVDYRQGYYAGKPYIKFTTADKDRQLEEAFMQGDPYTDLTMAMELNYFQLNRAEYFVPVEVKIPGRELALAKKNGAEHTLIDFILEVRDNFNLNGSPVQNMRDNMPIKLSDQTAVELAKRPVEYDTGFTLLPGKYTIKLLARDDVTGKIGTFETSFVIPNLNKEGKRVPISSVVLSSQRIDLKDAIYDAANEKDRAKQEAVNPLVLNGQKMIPSVTRVFSKSRDLYVYLQAYEQGTTNIQPLIAYVSFYQGETKAFETRAMEIASGMNNPLMTMPIRFSIGLSPLSPGDYDCQITVLNPTGQKSVYWQAPITLVP
jgi:VWFA-related protein